MKRFRIAAAFLLAVPSAVSAADITGQVSVIDGDTIGMHGQRIRLWGTDAPEADQFRDSGSVASNPPKPKSHLRSRNS